MWIILEPVIFALIGTEIQINKIDPTTIGYGTVVLVGALLIRFLFYSPSLPRISFFTMEIYPVSPLSSKTRRLSLLLILIAQ